MSIPMQDIQKQLELEELKKKSELELKIQEYNKQRVKILAGDYAGDADKLNIIASRQSSVDNMKRILKKYQDQQFEPELTNFIEQVLNSNELIFDDKLLLIRNALACMPISDLRSVLVQQLQSTNFASITTSRPLIFVLDKLFYEKNEGKGVLSKENLTLEDVLKNIFEADSDKKKSPEKYTKYFFQTLHQLKEIDFADDRKINVSLECAKKLLLLKSIATDSTQNACTRYMAAKFLFLDLPPRISPITQKSNDNTNEIVMMTLDEADSKLSVAAQKITQKDISESTRLVGERIRTAIQYDVYIDEIDSTTTSLKQQLEAGKNDKIVITNGRKKKKSQLQSNGGQTDTATPRSSSPASAEPTDSNSSPRTSQDSESQSTGLSAEPTTPRSPQELSDSQSPKGSPSIPRKSSSNVGDGSADRAFEASNTSLMTHEILADLGKREDLASGAVELIKQAQVQAKEKRLQEEIKLLAEAAIKEKEEAELKAKEEAAIKAQVEADRKTEIALINGYLQEIDNNKQALEKLLPTINNFLQYKAIERLSACVEKSLTMQSLVNRMKNFTKSLESLATKLAECPNELTTCIKQLNDTSHGAQHMLLPIHSLSLDELTAMKTRLSEVVKNSNKTKSDAEAIVNEISSAKKSISTIISYQVTNEKAIADSEKDNSNSPKIIQFVKSISHHVASLSQVVKMQKHLLDDKVRQYPYNTTRLFFAPFISVPWNNSNNIIELAAERDEKGQLKYDKNSPELVTLATPWWSWFMSAEKLNERIAATKVAFEDARESFKCDEYLSFANDCANIQQGKRVRNVPADDQSIPKIKRYLGMVNKNINYAQELLGTTNNRASAPGTLPSASNNLALSKEEISFNDSLQTLRYSLDKFKHELVPVEFPLPSTPVEKLSSELDAIHVDADKVAEELVPKMKIVSFNTKTNTQTVSYVPLIPGSKGGNIPLPAPAPSSHGDGNSPRAMV